MKRSLALLVLLFAPPIAPWAQSTLPTTEPPRSLPRRVNWPDGTLLPKHGGEGEFFVDPNGGGQRPSVRLLSASWGRLVDVHHLDGVGGVDPRPAFRDLVIHENIQSDSVDYLLETNPVTQRTRLVILRVRPWTPRENEFVTLLRQAMSNLPLVLLKEASDPPPFSTLARNATLVLQLDDLLEDGASAAQALAETVRVLVGTPATVPFAARVLFDPNHGGLADGEFHSTRVLVDMTVTPLEAADHPVPLPVNMIGLPASPVSWALTNVDLRIPTAVDPGSSQLALLTNLRGRALSATDNAPVDSSSPTVDVVRALRSGNDNDLGRGFLVDLQAPEIVGTWPLTVQSSTDDPAGRPGFEFLLDVTFDTTCRRAPRPGDVLLSFAQVVEVTRDPFSYDASTGQASGVPVTLLNADPIPPATLVGSGLLHTTFEAAAPVPPACWLSIAPAPGAPPGDALEPLSFVGVRFSEPMGAGTLRPFEGFRMIRGDATVPARPRSIVVAEVVASQDALQATLVPVLPLSHVQGTAETYTVQLGLGRPPYVTDLAGNQLAQLPPPIELSLDPSAPTGANGGFAMRLWPLDDVRLGPAAGKPDLRGQFLYGPDQEIRPRSMVRTSAPVDRTVFLPSLMIPFPPGTQAPLNPLGSKVQAIWRYADAGWQVEDEARHNLDVEGLNWSPAGGVVVADRYEEFEIALSHSNRLPDEVVNNFLLPKYPLSGLQTSRFADNVLDDPIGSQRVVHPRSLGYTINPLDVFVSPGGTRLIPFPLNRGPGPAQTYTWRDTAVVAQGGADGAGIPLDVERLYGLDPGPAGRVAPAGQVPSFGLPLLMELRCFPSTSGIGLNAFDVSLAINSSSLPTFRVQSSGGVDTSSNFVVKDPDLELVPSGGFNPFSSPVPGAPSRPDDNVVYMGQIDFVIRVSRVHTIFLDTRNAASDFFGPVIAATGPDAAQVVIEFRGATGFTGSAVNSPFDASRTDPYGEPEVTPLIVGGAPGWSSTLSDANGARYLQARMSFLNDTITGAVAVLDAFGFAYAEAQPLTRRKPKRKRAR